MSYNEWGGITLDHPTFFKEGVMNRLELLKQVYNESRRKKEQVNITFLIPTDEDDVIQDIVRHNRVAPTPSLRSGVYANTGYDE